MVFVVYRFLGAFVENRVFSPKTAVSERCGLLSCSSKIDARQMLNFYMQANWR